MILPKAAIILTLCFVNIRCDSNLLYEIATHQKYSTETCVSNILSKFFRCGAVTTFVNPNINVDQLLLNVNKDSICHSVITRSFADRNRYIWTNVYVIAAEDLLELRAGMLGLTTDVFWNPRARFIIQLNNLNEAEGIQDLFKIMLKYKVYKVILLRISGNDAFIYTYDPFENYNCGKNFDKVITLGTCENPGNITNYFPKSLPKELKNCTIKVVATDDVPNFISETSNYTVYGKYVPGLEQYVLNTIADFEEFSIEYEVFGEDEIYNGIVLPNHTSTGLLSYIDKDGADVAAGGYILMKNRVELFDYLYGFNYASYNLYTPVIGNHAWKRVYREFGSSTWSLIGGAFILVMIVSQILKLILNDRTCSVLNIWGYFFENANSGMSRNERFRIIIFFWSWFTFFISSFYNTALFSLITVHVHETPHSISADNLKTLPFMPCISDNSRMFFQFAYNQQLPEGPPIHNCTYTDGALHYVASTKKFYAIELEYSYSLKEYEYMDANGKHLLESWIFSSINIIVIYLVRGFPFRNKFQQYATRMYEAGLIKNHLQTIHLRSYRAVKIHPTTFKNVNLVDLWLHFCILGLGYVLSFICFLFELWYNYETQEGKIKIKNK